MEAKSSPPIVILNLRENDRHTRCSALLQAAGFQCRESNLLADAGRADLLISDHSVSAAAIAPGECEPPATQDASGDCANGATAEASIVDQGLILIGQDAPADVNLPADATDREIVLACRLLIDVVRLRRQCRHEAKQQSTLLQMVLTDPLTGLGNRRGWQEALRERWTIARGTGQAICLVAMDFDQFKQLNDTHGHAAGDRALEIAGEVLAAAVRRDDFVSRLGGDEFGLLLVGVNPDSVAAVVERVRAKLTARLTAEAAAPLSASAGYALAIEPDLPPAATLFAAADTALQQAKRLGRNQTVAAQVAATTPASAATTPAAASDPAPQPAGPTSTGNVPAPAGALSKPQLLRTLGSHVTR